MTNTARGETSFMASGEKFVMKLTLGALAEIESALNVKNLGDLSSALKQFGASDIAQVAAALLRAGGHNLTASEVLALPVELGTVIGAIGDAFNVAGSKTAPLPGAGASNSASGA
jgi:hypothetical protein